MAKREYGGAMLPDCPPDEQPLEECAPFFLAKELDDLPLDEMGPIVTMKDPFHPDFEIVCANPYHNNIERIGSFKQILMSRFYSDYISFLKDKIEDGLLPLGKRSRIVSNPDTVLVSEAEVQRIDLYRKSAEQVYADIIMSAKIYVSSELDGIPRSDHLTQWYRVRTYSDLNREMPSFNNLVCVFVYERSELAPGIALDEYLIPYTSAALLDSECTGILSVYCPEVLELPCRVDGDMLAQRMGLQVMYCRLADAGDTRGQIYFEEHETSVINDNGKTEKRVVPANTIVVNLDLCLDRDGMLDPDKRNDTVIHECYHAYRHQLFYLGQLLYNSELRCLTCTVAGQQIGAMLDARLEQQGNAGMQNMSLAANCYYGKTPVDWMEWQTNRATPRIRMPARTTEMKIDALLSGYRNRYPGISTPRLYSKVVSDLAAFFGVSKQSAKLRMVELGYSEAKGVFNYVNGKYAIDYAFSPGSLKRNQTFTIGFAAAIELYRSSTEFRECIDSGLFQYIDDHFCLVSSKYVYRRGGLLHLTSYAKSHMEECCLIFTMGSAEVGYSYREGCLQKQAIGTEETATFEGCCSEAVDLFTAAQTLSTILNDLPRSPCGTLKSHMERRKITLEALVAKSGVSERTIKRLRSDPEYVPSKQNLFAICVGLQLEPLLQKDWMGKLGITMTANTTDVFMDMLMGSYYKQPISKINEVLAMNGFPPLSRCVEELDQ